MMTNTLDKVPSRLHDVLIDRRQHDIEQKRGRFNVNPAKDLSLNLLEVVNRVKQGRAISEGMWVCAYNWVFGQMKGRYGSFNWKRSLDILDELVLLFFEHIRHNKDVPSKYYIFRWRKHLPKFYLYLFLKRKGIAMPEIKGSIFNVLPQQFCNYMFLVIQFQKDNGGRIDRSLFVKWYKEKAKMPTYHKGAVATKNFLTVLDWYHRALVGMEEIAWANP